MRSNLQENPEKIYSVNYNKTISNDKVVLNYGNNKYKNIKDVFSDGNKQPSFNTQTSTSERPNSALLNAVGRKFNRDGIETIVKPVNPKDYTKHQVPTMVNYFDSAKKNFSNIDKEHDKKRSQLRLLLRFNCGKCQKRYSQIIIPSILARECEKCKYPSDLVVLRCDDTNLIGGFLCCNCEHRFLDKLNMGEFNPVTPFCFECNKYSKMYQALINRSKISIRNEKLYYCLTCGNSKSISFYQPGKTKPAMICCENLMEYNTLNRVFKYYQLDEDGRSETYSRDDYHKSYRMNNWKKKEKKISQYDSYKYYSDRDNLPKFKSSRKPSLIDKLLSSRIDN